MPLPVAPIALAALRYGPIAYAAFKVVQNVEMGRRDQRAEDLHDDTPEGFTLHRDPEHLRATGRSKRIIRFGKSGPGVEIDATAFGRIKVKKV